jgi:(1->4)-alpha-D-glucan 1-alpha-D-glucosylmutase
MKDDSSQPMATYRLQFNQDFRLPDAQTLVPYFSRLGITHVYASPLLRSRQTSTHGYDMVDPAMLHPAIGNMTELTTFVTELRKLGLGLLLDIVPNHMAASIENPYWRDVLTYGHSSPFARWFDIDWRLPDPDMWGRVLVPILGAPRSQVLSCDQIRLIWSDGRFLLQYFEHYFPIDPATIPAICEFGWGDLVSCLEREPPALERMNVILEYLRKLPKLVVRLRKRVDVDREETERWLADFARLVVQSPTIERWAEQTADGFTRAEGGVRRLRQLLDSQPYRLVHWREAAQKINYRRFFDINELISIRQEDPQVFEATHTMVLRLFDDGLLDGLRIDHIDGLRDPLGYLKRLSEALAARTRSRQATPVFVEKILAAGEQLPAGWPAAGTTGYEFLNQVEAVFVSVPGFAELEQQYCRMLRRPVHFREVAAGGKRRILRNDLAPQVARLADTLLRLLERQTVARSRRRRTVAAVAAPQEGPAAVAAPQEVPAAESAAIPGGDLPVPAAPAGDRPDNASSPAMHPPSLPGLTKRDMVDAIVEVIVALPVYRTYVVSSQTTVSGADRQYVETALQDALRNGRAAPAAIGFLGQVLLLEGAACLVEHERNQRLNFIQRFQQLTGPAAAKGIEDTAFYVYVPLASLNEVGGEPQLPADDPVAALHQANAQRAAVWPRTMLCVTTHDTKRTADVRARLDVLAELPNLWTGTVARWRRLNQVHRRRVGGKRTPDAGMEYLCYQTMLGLWPAPDPGRPEEVPSGSVLQDLRERIEAYMIKAAREAKTYTSWINEDREYEDALVAFVRSLFLSADNRGSSFPAEVQRLAARVARPGFWNSLSRTMIQFTAPGTPDLYQGDELWNFALVDPDNRRPVDYERRRQLLDDVITGLEAADEPRREFLRNLAAAPEDGRIKLHVIRCALAARRDHARLFASGQYLPLTAEGPACKHLVAFARVPDAALGTPAE